jgi:hypothetical protein
MTSKKKWSSPEICDIFEPLYYGRIERMYDDSYHIIAELLNLDILSFAEESTNITDYKPAPPKSDTYKHQLLKGLGAKILENMGETNVEFEYKNYDVFGHELKIRIECGHTKGKRIFYLLPLPYEKVMSEFWVLRYHYVGIKNNLFKFKPNLDKLKEFENYIKNHIKKNNEYKEKHGNYPEFWNPELGHKLTPFVDSKDAIWHLLNIP